MRYRRSTNFSLQLVGNSLLYTLTKITI